jgi:hypothetical protein
MGKSVKSTINNTNYRGNMDKQEFCTVKYRGKELVLTQNPYICGTDAYSWYACHAVDNEEEEYIVTWDITNPACDWEVYSVGAL